jgi:hypothetical protein
MRFQPAKIIRLEIRLQQIAQAAVYRIEILARAIRRDVVGTARERLRFLERFGRRKRVHG